MDKKALRQLSKSDLIRIIVSQAEQNAQLESRVLQLEQRLTMHDNAHTPSSKKRKKNTAAASSDKARFPGKPPGSGGGGVQLPPPDEVKEHTLDVCPQTGGPLRQIGVRKKMVIDFPEKPLRVIEHRIIQYYSLHLGIVVEPVVSLPSGIYGPHLRSIIVMLKQQGLSHAKISLVMRQLGAPSFSTASVQAISDDCAQRLTPVRKSILASLRRHKHLHADETGLRKDGKNGYVWGLFTQKCAAFLATLSRAREELTYFLGDTYAGVVVTDGYVGYNHLKQRQRCWPHMLRQFKYDAEHNDEIALQYAALCDLYGELKQMLALAPEQRDIQRAKAHFEHIIVRLKVIRGAGHLVTLMENGGEDWFTALNYSGIPLDNNMAERGLRPLVLLRKTIGCYRNEKGKRWIENALSTLYTWQLQQKNIFCQLNDIWD